MKKPSNRPRKTAFITITISEFQAAKHGLLFCGNCGKPPNNHFDDGTCGYPFHLANSSTCKYDQRVLVYTNSADEDLSHKRVEVKAHIHKQKKPTPKKGKK